MQEERVANDIGGRVQAGSGNSWKAKSDVRDATKLRIECKYTEKPSYTLKLADLEKIQNEAVLGGLEDWAMQIEFVVPGAYSSVKFAVAPYVVVKEWWDQFGEGPLEERKVDVEVSSTRLVLRELWTLSYEMSLLKRTWLREYAFHKNPRPYRYALLDWDLFIRLMEKSKEKS